MEEKKIYTITEVAKKLNVLSYQIEYLFRSGRLKKEDFPMFAGKRVFYDKDFDVIRNALFDVALR